ncbi:MAG: DUF58 domain-containing protein [Planctomycetota bacterium]
MAPTSLGWKALAFLLVLLVSFFAAPYQNLFFLLISFLGVLGVLNTWWTVQNLRGLSAEVLDITPAPAGARQEIRLQVHAGARPRFQLSGGLSLAGGAAGVSASVGLVEGDSLLVASLPAGPRGLYRVESAFLESTYPLGLLRARRRIPSPPEAVVYPEPTELPRERSWNDVVAEVCGLLNPIDGNLQPSGLREFVAGDELRRVHWKASARRGALVVTEWEGASARGIAVVLDCRAETQSFEEALSLITALALLVEENKELITVHAQGFSGTFGKGQEPLRRLLTWLARTERLPDDAPAPPATSPSVIRLPLCAGDARPAAAGAER